MIRAITKAERRKYRVRRPRRKKQIHHQYDDVVVRKVWTREQGTAWLKDATRLQRVGLDRETKRLLLPHRPWSTTPDFGRA
jgi:hypothetical protein